MIEVLKGIYLFTVSCYKLWEILPERVCQHSGFDHSILSIASYLSPSKLLDVKCNYKVALVCVPG